MFRRSTSLLGLVLLVFANELRIRLPPFKFVTYSFVKLHQTIVLTYL